jgi:hypothetical protein
MLAAVASQEGLVRCATFLSMQFAILVGQAWMGQRDIEPNH